VEIQPAALFLNETMTSAQQAS